jgi:hypothetical protein
MSSLDATTLLLTSWFIMVALICSSILYFNLISILKTKIKIGLVVLILFMFFNGTWFLHEIKDYFFELSQPTIYILIIISLVLVNHYSGFWYVLYNMHTYVPAVPPVTDAADAAAKYAASLLYGLKTPSIQYSILLFMLCSLGLWLGFNRLLPGSVPGVWVIAVCIGVLVFTVSQASYTITQASNYYSFKSIGMFNEKLLKTSRAKLTKSNTDGNINDGYLMMIAHYTGVSNGIQGSLNIVDGALSNLKNHMANGTEPDLVTAQQWFPNLIKFPGNETLLKKLTTRKYLLTSRKAKLNMLKTKASKSDNLIFEAYKRIFNKTSRRPKLDNSLLTDLLKDVTGTQKGGYKTQTGGGYWSITGEGAEITIDTDVVHKLLYAEVTGIKNNNNGGVLNPGIDKYLLGKRKMNDYIKNMYNVLLYNEIQTKLLKSYKELTKVDKTRRIISSTGNPLSYNQAELQTKIGALRDIIYNNWANDGITEDENGKHVHRYEYTTLTDILINIPVHMALYIWNNHGFSHKKYIIILLIICGAVYAWYESGRSALYLYLPNRDDSGLRVKSTKRKTDNLAYTKLLTNKIQNVDWNHMIRLSQVKRDVELDQYIRDNAISNADHHMSPEAMVQYVNKHARYLYGVLYNIETDSDNNKNQILLKTPIYINKPRVIKTNIFEQQEYNYGVSSWIFIHIQGDRPAPGSQEDGYRSILDFGGIPKISYKVNDSTFRITTQVQTNDGYETDTIYETSKFLLQKWNNVVVNYVGGTVDVFINGELVSSNINKIPYIKKGIVTVGQDKGTEGGICNITYFARPIPLSKIVEYYDSLKKQDPPVIY